jgi:glycosyltransferase involved in cell wall biosynthesis
MKKIAINARVLNERKGGPARYTRSVIKELCRLDRRNKYFLLFYDDPDFDFEIPLNFIVQIYRFRSKFLFDYIIIPLFSYFNQIDIFIFPKNTFSPFVKGKKIPIYHDLVYFEKFTFREFKFFDHLHHKIMIPISSMFSTIDVSVSDFTAERMKTLLKIDKRKIRVIKEGVEPHFKIIRNRQILQKVKNKFSIQQPFFFYSGSLSPRKNFVNVVNALEKIRDKIPHKIYVTGGDSWLDSGVFSLIDKHSLNDRFIRLGYLSEEELVVMYNLAECYLYPSLYEGFGLPILESQACGCPLITSLRSSCPEVAGDAALFVDPENVEDLAGAMLQISKDKVLRRRLIHRGILNSKKFKWKDTADKLKQLIEEI